MKSEIIPAVFATDDNYLPYCGVAVSSLIKNTTPDNNYEIYVLYDKLTAFNRFRLESLSAPNAPVKCLCIHEYIKDLAIIEHGHLSVATTYRLIIPEVLPQFDKVIYLDSDIIVNNDVKKLFEIDIDDNILGAAYGYSNEFIDNYYLNMLGDKAYFNAGVVLINSVKYRELGIKELCLKLLTTRDDLNYMDQDALNIICRNSVYFLPFDWNYEWGSIIYYGFSIERIQSNIPSIVHYDGASKPWEYPEYPYADLFWKYARNTAFYEEIIKRMNEKSFQNHTSILCLLSETKKVAVYGAGMFGKILIKKILGLSIFEIVAWVDVNYKEKTGLQLHVYPVEKLYDTDFDIVIIAMYDDDVAETIKQTLVANGIDSNKIRRFK